MLSPLEIDFDPSNQSFNVFFLEVTATGRPVDAEELWQALPYGFQSWGHAAKFVQPQLERPLYQEDAISMWYGDLKPGNPLSGNRVRINQLVMVI